jgi:hypothetical protein
MSFYTYYQTNRSEEWRCTIEGGLGLLSLAPGEHVTFATALHVDVSTAEGAEVTKEEWENAKYKGDLYIDLDEQDAATAIKQFKALLTKLQEKGLDLEMLRLYATGGRGFHIEIPIKTFVDKPSGQGYRNLPHIYKEMVYQVFVDGVDLSIYSGKRGRMWRLPNVRRDNGNYKVPLTLEEAQGLTLDTYASLVQTPREEPERKEPELCVNFALVWAQSRDKVDAALKRKRNSKVDERLVKQWEGQAPPTIKGLMDGEGVRSGKGFQAIATQLAITAHTLGIKLDDFLEQCEGLIQNHQGDSMRYGTPGRRKRELARMWNYMEGNPCYEFSVGAIKSIVEEGRPTPDLALNLEDAVPTDAEGNPVEDGEIAFSLSLGVRVNKAGIWRPDKEAGNVLVCSIGIDEETISQLVEGDTGNVIGYEMDIYQDGKRKGRKFLTMDLFSSTQAFLKFVLPMSGTLQMTDAQIRALPELFRKHAEMRGDKTYTVAREGVDLIRLPEGADHETDMIYAHSDGVISAAGISYRLKNQYNSDGSSYFRSDLHRASPLGELSEAKKEEVRQILHKFLHLNTPENVAKCVGFMLAAFLSQPIRRIYGEFPLLQIYGTASSGKSAYVGLLMGLHYYRSVPRILAGDSVTKFGLELAFMSSASIPVVLDEVKPREMSRGKTMMLKQMLRNNYNNNMSVKGHVSRERGGSSQLGVTHLANEAPLVFIGEALESQSAIMDRSIVVTMTPEGRAGKSRDFLDCRTHSDLLGHFGASCVHAALALSHDWLKQTREAFLDIIYPALGQRADRCERPIKNYATCLTGLQFGRVVLEQVYGEEFNPIFRELQQVLLDRVDEIVPFNMTEASKVLNTLAYMSGLADGNALNIGTDYTLSEHKGKPCVDIVLRNAFDKYARFQKARGEETLFDNEAAFLSAMQTHPAVVDKVCADTLETLKGGRPSVKVFRFDLEKLYGEERVEEFQGIPSPFKTQTQTEVQLP